MSDRLLRAVTTALRARGALDGTTLDHVTVGDDAVLVELAGGDGSAPRAGITHRPPGPAPAVDGTSIGDVLTWATATGGDEHDDDTDDVLIRRAIGVAALNAASAPLLDWRTGDPMALLDPDVTTVATVGLFRPAFEKFSDVDVRVIERRDVGPVNAPDDVTVRMFHPEEAATAMAGAEVVFITGSAFIYGGVEDYLDTAPTDATVVVIGATASVLPDPLFDAGVDVVAGARVTNPVSVRAVIEAGACGTDLHHAGVEKVFVAADTPHGLDLD